MRDLTSPTIRLIRHASRCGVVHFIGWQLLTELRHADSLARLQIERTCTRALHFTGPRPLAQAIIAIAERFNVPLPAVCDLMAEHAATPYETLQAAGGDRLVPRPVEVVPDDLDLEGAP
jgi:hypothetical protein